MIQAREHGDHVRNFSQRISQARSLTMCQATPTHRRTRGWVKKGGRRRTLSARVTGYNNRSQKLVSDRAKILGRASWSTFTRVRLLYHRGCHRCWPRCTFKTRFAWKADAVNEVRGSCFLSVIKKSRALPALLQRTLVLALIFSSSFCKNQGSAAVHKI